MSPEFHADLLYLPCTVGAQPGPQHAVAFRKIYNVLRLWDSELPEPTTIDDERLDARLLYTQTAFTVVMAQHDSPEAPPQVISLLSQDDPDDMVEAPPPPPPPAPTCRTSSRRRTQVPTYHEAYQLHRAPPTEEQRRLAQLERQGLSQLLEVRADGFGGQGLFALRSIPAGLRLTYFGETINETDLRRRYPNESDALYVMQRLNVYVDAQDMTEALARYVNHSSHNGQMVLTVDSQRQSDEPYIIFEQRRPIAEGQQLWVNYGRDYFFGQNGEPIDRGFDY